MKPLPTGNVLFAAAIHRWLRRMLLDDYNVAPAVGALLERSLPQGFAYPR